MSSGWCYGYDIVLMHRHIQVKFLYMREQFGVGGKLYVEVIRTSFSTAKHRKEPNCHAHQI